MGLIRKHSTYSSDWLTIIFSISKFKEVTRDNDSYQEEVKCLFFDF